MTFAESSPESADIRGLVVRVDSGAPMTEAERVAALETFEQYECWQPYFRLIRRAIADSGRRDVLDYVRLARVQNLYLEDVFAAADTCVALVRDLRVPYERFVTEVLPKIVEFEDFAAEATILGAVSDKFVAIEGRIKCLERLCMLYEKKTHNETQLARTYERLLESDPRNVKALRYFKLVYTQNNDWEEVVGTLKTLLECVSHPQEVFRVGQELAAIYLYQLDMAPDAIRVLETYCAESPLDTSNILFDAYQRLADWNGCLRVLRQSLLTVDDDFGRATLHYKIGALLDQLGDQDGALDNYAKATRLAPPFYDAIEGIVTIAVARKDWSMVLDWFKTLEERVIDDRLRAQLRQASKRLADGRVRGAGS